MRAHGWILLLTLALALDVPSPAHEFRIGVSLPSERRPETSAGSSANAVEVTITSACASFSRLTAASTLLAPVA